MKQQKNRIARVNDQALRMRKLYSQIGEPLPADVIIDLYRHLGNALELSEEREHKQIRSAKTACGRPH